MISSFTSPKPLITVKEARKLLGSDSKGIDDYQMQELLQRLTNIAKLQVENFGSKKTLGHDKLNQ